MPEWSLMVDWYLEEYPTMTRAEVVTLFRQAVISDG